MRRTVYFLHLLSILFVSCEDVINIKLKNAESRLVIIGEIQNHSNRQVIKLSKTVPFSSQSDFQGVSNADVQVVDGQGNRFEVTERSPGIYISDFVGTVFEFYELYVSVAGKTYAAVSRMPPFVRIDSVGTAISDFFGEENKDVSLKYQDPPLEENFYRYLMSINGGTATFVNTASDKFNDGKYVTERLNDPDEDLIAGDEVVVYMQCVDKAMFDFW